MYVLNYYLFYLQYVNVVSSIFPCCTNWSIEVLSCKKAPAAFLLCIHPHNMLYNIHYMMLMFLKGNAQNQIRCQSSKHHVHTCWLLQTASLYISLIISKVTTSLNKGLNIEMLRRLLWCSLKIFTQKKTWRNNHRQVGAFVHFTGTILENWITLI